MTLQDSMPAFQHCDWAAVPVERIADGIQRQMIWGERIMVCRLQFAPHVVTAVHSHPHEQITLVERGRVRFAIEDDHRIATAGEVLHFPAHVRHGATMLDEEVVLVDIFSPIREDFLPAAQTRPTERE
jgi:quercetin dioxygenase-like cupin family protein